MGITVKNEGRRNIAVLTTSGIQVLRAGKSETYDDVLNADDLKKVHGVGLDASNDAQDVKVSGTSEKKEPEKEEPEKEEPEEEDDEEETPAPAAPVAQPAAPQQARPQNQPNNRRR